MSNQEHKVESTKEATSLSVAEDVMSLKDKDLLAERDRLREVNAELVAALQAVTILASSSMAGAKANLSKAGSIARAAIAKAKGE